ncbi:MAG: thiamine-phosphate synthase family protein, partial [Methermicoccaceae archaeon]
RDALRILQNCKEFSHLIPEVGTNIVMCTYGAREEEEVAAVSGRIVRYPLLEESREGERSSYVPRACGDVWLGGSGHMARAVLAAHAIHPAIRSAINLRSSPELIRKCESLGMKVVHFSRRDEPEDVSTMEWGVSHALSEGVADVVYDLGDVGKEPMVRLFGTRALEVAKRAVELARMLQQN